LPYLDNLDVSELRGEDSHLITFEEEEDTPTEKLDKIKDFIEFRSFIELNEVNILSTSSELDNVISDSDLIGYQLNDPDYLADSYANTLPVSMKVMSYNDDETLFYKKVAIGEDNTCNLIVLYSDKLTPSTNRLMIYTIDDNKSDNVVKYNYFNISVMQGQRIQSNKIYLDTTASIVKQIINSYDSLPSPKTYAQLSELLNLKGLGAIDCSINSNLFGQEINKKPILKIDYTIGYGEKSNIESVAYTSGTIIIGDYNTLAEANNALGGTGFTGDFKKGVVSVCKII
jgi:hypothetical protein